MYVLSELNEFYFEYGLLCRTWISLRIDFIYCIRAVPQLQSSVMAGDDRLNAHWSVSQLLNAPLDALNEQTDVDAPNDGNVATSREPTRLNHHYSV